MDTIAAAAMGRDGLSLPGPQQGVSFAAEHSSEAVELAPLNFARACTWVTYLVGYVFATTQRGDHRFDGKDPLGGPRQLGGCIPSALYSLPSTLYPLPSTLYPLRTASGA